jgi:hypothetical protein
VVAEAAKRLGLPYVRFHAVYAEGYVTYGGGLEGEPPQQLPMQPVWVTLGDYDNLLALRCINHRGNQGRVTLQDHSVSHHFKDLDPGTHVTFSYGGSKKPDAEVIDDWPFGEGEEAWAGLYAAPITYLLDQKPVKTRPFSAQDRLDLLMPTEGGYNFPDVVVLPGADDVASTIPGAYFHLDSDGGSCFTAEEAEAASAHLLEMDFLAHVQSRTQGTPFLLPQHHGAEAFFCNEAVYGRANLLEVSGVVRLAPLDKPLPPPPAVPEETPQWIAEGLEAAHNEGGSDMEPEVDDSEDVLDAMEGLDEQPVEEVAVPPQGAEAGSSSGGCTMV